MERRFGVEWARCYGGARFDHVVDFSGYSPTWAFLLAQAPGSTRSIWLHNDLAADQRRTVEGFRAHENNLGTVFSSYRHFDHLVSVSPALKEINAASLADHAPADRFTFARNVIDVDRVMAGVAEAGTPGQAPVVSRTPGVTMFVTMGRVSPEKNHERLVRAFSRVHAETPDTRLVIVGDGPLLPRVRQVAADLGVEGSVVLTGQQADPFGVLAAGDVFVLSSDYEGQPMVILEAMVLGLPVVTTAFGSVGSALPEGVGLVVAPSVEALAEGMRAALRAEVPHPAFDAEAYNSEVLAEFYRAIGLPDEGRG
jgi:glycosyltransferase involved in cell wall biosynthesis